MAGRTKSYQVVLLWPMGRPRDIVVDLDRLVVASRAQSTPLREDDHPLLLRQGTALPRFAHIVEDHAGEAR